MVLARELAPLPRRRKPAPPPASCGRARRRAAPPTGRCARDQSPHSRPGGRLLPAVRRCHAAKLRTGSMHGGGPAQAERAGEHELRLAREQELAEGAAVHRPGAVGAGGVDGPDLVVHAEQDQVDAAEVALGDAKLAAAVVAADEDAALELVAPDRVGGGGLAGPCVLDCTVMVASRNDPGDGACRAFSGCGGGRISWLRGAKARQVSPASRAQGFAEGPVGRRKRT